MHLIGAELADLVQFGQCRKAKPVIVYCRLIRLEHLLNVVRQRQSEVAHQIYILFPSTPHNARVESFFVADGGTPIATIVVGREHQCLIRKREELLCNRVKLFAGIAAGKITPAGTANEQVCRRSAPGLLRRG